jgi:ABC-type amino acid transport substrate-binding protein
MKKPCGRAGRLPCVAQTAERERYFLFSIPIYLPARGVHQRRNKRPQRVQRFIRQNRAVQMNSSHHSYLTQFPEIKLSLYPTVEAGLRAVSKGTELAFIGNMATFQLPCAGKWNYKPQIFYH